jgi:hypothetical protein
MDTSFRNADNDSGGIDKPKKMGDPVKFGSFIIQTLLFLGAIAGIYMTLSEKVATQQVVIDYLRDTDKYRASQIKEMSQQFNEINEKLTDILIKLENKENKK